MKELIKWFKYCKACGGLWGTHNPFTHLEIELYQMQKLALLEDILDTKRD